MRRLTLVLCIICILLMSGCGKKNTIPNNPIVFEYDTNDDYAYLSVDEKVYVPYCPYKREYLGNCIGYYDYQGHEYSEDERVYVYEFKGYSSDEWIIDYDSKINEGMIMREINTTNIPEGLVSEYDWNS